MKPKPPTVKLRSKPKPNQNTRELAQHYLAQHGTSHYKEVVRGIKDMGWQSSGDDRLDEKNVNQLLSKDPIFQSLGGRSGKFKLADPKPANV
jgi:hypothetical protein